MQSSARVELQALDFDYSSRRLHVKCMGHPTECLDLAHELGSVILGRQYRWHITYINGKLPEDYIQPSEMLMNIQMDGFDT